MGLYNNSLCNWHLYLVTQRNVFRVHLYCSMHQCSTPFSGWKIFHCHTLFIHSFISRTFGLFPVWGCYLCKQSCINFLTKHLFLILLNIYLGVELPGYLSCCWTIWRTARLFYKAAEPFYIPVNSAEGCQFLHIFINTCYYLSLDYGHTNVELWEFFAYSGY